MVYIVAAMMAREEVIRSRRMVVMSYALDAESALGNERRAGTVINGVDISVPCN